MKNIIFHSASLCLRCDTNVALCVKGSVEMRKVMSKKVGILLSIIGIVFSLISILLSVNGWDF